MRLRRAPKSSTDQTNWTKFYQTLFTKKQTRKRWQVRIKTRNDCGAELKQN